MLKIKINILIRVYDRIEDLDLLLEVIHRTWKNFDYFILIVSNGKTNGYELDAKIKSRADKIVELHNNAGHLKGNAQLLQEGVRYLKPDAKYTIILEADTWIYTDDIIKKYIGIMQKENSVWASAQWYSRFYSLATDFAIINTDFLLSNTEIFDYTGYPECYSANFIIEKKQKYIYIKENMPVHVPGYIKKYPFAPKSRFYMFPKSGMITHHIEELKGSMEEKKYCFNAIAGKDFFETDYKGIPYNKYINKLMLAIKLSKLLPNRTWVSKPRQAKIATK